MRKIIKKADVNPTTKQFKINEMVVHKGYFHDGRSYVSNDIEGVVVKVNKVTLDMMVGSGDVVRVDIKGVKKLWDLH